MDKFSKMTLAYKYVGLAALLAEINFCADRMGLAINLPIPKSDLRETYVSPTWLEFGGTLTTTTYRFGLVAGQLRTVTRQNLDSDLSIRERHEKWATMKSLLGTNEAYQLATQWLSAIEIDVKELERKHPVQVKQRFFYPDAIDADEQPPDALKRKIMLPAFAIEWGKGLNPAVQISVFGPTKELTRMYIRDTAVIRRPKLSLRNPERLLAISDNDFKRFSDEQKAKLLEEHLPSINYPSVRPRKEPEPPNVDGSPPSRSLRAPERRQARITNALNFDRRKDAKLPLVLPSSADEP